MQTVHIPTIPAPLFWHNQPPSWHYSPQGVLSVSAGEKTDWFISPNGNFVADNAAALLFDSPDAGMLSAHVTVDFNGLFDAGVLVVYHHPRLWAKLCLELSPLGKLMIVSVVTKELSDDCNSYLVDGKSAYLRVSRLENAFAFHASADGATWNLIRHFTLGPMDGLKMGFLAQAPTGAGVTVQFDQIAYTPGLLKDIRSGA